MENKKILILGGGRNQINLIKKAESMGYRTVVSDYYSDAPGKSFCSYSTMTDTMDVEENVKIAKKYNVSGVITMGTDQPLNTMAKVAKELNLPCYLSPKSALICTDKKSMIEAVEAYNLKRPKSLIVGEKDDIIERVSCLKFPLVVKPSDSQGQRGIKIVFKKNALKSSVQEALVESKIKKVVVEEFIEGSEITISAWLTDGKSQILAITDRVTYNSDYALGVCFQHKHPSKHAKNINENVVEITENIGKAYGVTDGPLYIQFIVNNKELFFVEGSCRIGGGHEEALIPLITGVSVTENLIEIALTGRSKISMLPYEEIQNRYAMVNFLLAHPGQIEKQFVDDKVSDKIKEGGFFKSVGTIQSTINTAVDRVGYFICSAESAESLDCISRHIYDNHNIVNTEKYNILFWPESYSISGN